MGNNHWWFQDAEKLSGASLVCAIEIVKGRFGFSNQRDWDVDADAAMELVAEMNADAEFDGVSIDYYRGRWITSLGFCAAEKDLSGKSANSGTSGFCEAVCRLYLVYRRHTAGTRKAG